jgi:hypothetical protein
MNNEFEWMWKEVVMAKVEVVSWHLPGGTEEIHKSPVRIDSVLINI